MLGRWQRRGAMEGHVNPLEFVPDLLVRGDG
jgi:hypothetical protein